MSNSAWNADASWIADDDVDDESDDDVDDEDRFSADYAGPELDHRMQQLAELGVPVESSRGQLFGRSYAGELDRSAVVQAWSDLYGSELHGEGLSQSGSQQPAQPTEDKQQLELASLLRRVQSGDVAAIEEMRQRYKSGLGVYGGPGGYSI